jgi:cytochrome c oxidase cbb3-type subunit 2
VLRIVGVPYTDAQIEGAAHDLEEQANADPTGAPPPVAAQYPKARLGRAISGDDGPVREIDALVAYLQVLGTMVDFTTVDPDKIRR